MSHWPVRTILNKALRPSVSYTYSLSRSVYNPRAPSQERLPDRLRKKRQYPYAKQSNAGDNHEFQDYFVTTELLRTLSRLGFRTATSVLASLLHQQRKDLRLQKYNPSTALRIAASDKGTRAIIAPILCIRNQLLTERTLKHGYNITKGFSVLRNWSLYVTRTFFRSYSTPVEEPTFTNGMPDHAWRLESIRSRPPLKVEFPRPA